MFAADFGSKCYELVPGVRREVTCVIKSPLDGITTVFGQQR